MLLLLLAFSYITYYDQCKYALEFDKSIYLDWMHGETFNVIVIL